MKKVRFMFLPTSIVCVHDNNVFPCYLLISRKLLQRVADCIAIHTVSDHVWALEFLNWAVRVQSPARQHFGCCLSLHQNWETHL